MTNLPQELRQMEHSKYCRTVLWGESAISCDCYMRKVHQAADEIEGLNALVKKLRSEAGLDILDGDDE